MVPVRRARWVSMVSAMPSPPVSSAVSPASVRKVASRSVTRVTWGCTSRGLRARQPASGQLRCRPATNAAGVDPSRQGQLVLVARQRAGQQHLGRVQRVAADEQARADAEAEQAADPVGLAHQHGRDPDRGLADLHAVADADAEPGQERRLGHAHRRSRSASASGSGGSSTTVPTSG